METILKLLSPISFFKKQSLLVAISDPTIYQVETHTNIYCGRIMHQDDTVIRFQSSEGKPIKILKKNINRITIL
jgi:hypothetical protein